MDEEAMLQKVNEETMRFMRGKYVLDEVSNGKDELKFRRGGKTVLTIYIRDNRYDFLVIFGKAERGKYELERDTFPKGIRDIYDNSKTYHDGKWMMIPVADLDMLEAVKRLVMIKKRPNRRPFPKDTAVYSKCGMRCDLCVHYTGGTISDEWREELRERVGRVYGGDNYGEDMMLCSGCPGKCMDDECGIIQCLAAKGLGMCGECNNFPCEKAIVRCGIEARSISADDITWAVLPYVHNQYGN